MERMNTPYLRICENNLMSAPIAIKLFMEKITSMDDVEFTVHTGIHLELVSKELSPGNLSQ